MGKIKFAVTPGFEVGGTLFRPEQLALIGSVIGKEGKVEMTTFKQLYVEMEEESAEAAKSALETAGLQVHPAGFYTKSLITCNFCKGEEDAGLPIARQLDEAIAGHETPSPLKIGYSGCALATGEPLLKDIGIVKMRDTFDIYIGGEAKSLKPTLGRPLATGVPEAGLIAAVLGLIRHFQAHGKKKEKFAKFIDRIGMDALREAAE
ncbi:nitrite reductase [Paenibacillus sp. MBLB4367]|uniref:nitrite reductase n=1 Tax=Paenibacillus sp. MBLB4367 TaxID=3384767 RepID=UPI00390831A8